MGNTNGLHLGKGIKMPSSLTWFHRPRVRYEHLNASIEMADRTVIPTDANEEGREQSKEDQKFSYDVYGGDLDKDAAHHRRERELNYVPGNDSTSTLDGVPSEPEEASEDVSEEDLATLRRVSDRIPLSAWYATDCMPSLTFFRGLLSLLNCANDSHTTV
jgi:hypothetical protein